MARAKKEKAEMSEAQSKIVSIVKNLAQKYGSLEDVQIERVVETEKVVIVIASADSAAKLVGKEGSIVKMISKELGKQVKVLSAASDQKTMTRDLLRPASLIGINVLYTAGKEELKIRVPLKDKPLLLIPESELERVFGEIFSKTSKISFE